MRLVRLAEYQSIFSCTSFSLLLKKVYSTATSKNWNHFFHTDHRVTIVNDRFSGNHCSHNMRKEDLIQELLFHVCRNIICVLLIILLNYKLFLEIHTQNAETYYVFLKEYWVHSNISTMLFTLLIFCT